MPPFQYSWPFPRRQPDVRMALENSCGRTVGAGVVEDEDI
jgi:hypothetical protein